ncbi:sigma-70 family RNA polymerase sigma factor [Kordiimonas sp. SCSIO 12610]|uniref:sigma-70 family RNA polymerase sigma factor n=1 Tax=Kordiimonas sp. SCSIO 12610 TaxID=2829597 RepID=UPI00210B6C6F|nr:sigma-70 family RNA polymerase sigma factor [Kordiimonas sp. SCSIO 12610]UTW55504.1 sigma-70 family RNA polymerase sigma factor [Kordiimonas sp. SCSIO 12610]
MAMNALNMTDEELVEAIVSGNRQAYAKLVDKYARQFRMIAYRLLGDMSFAEDMVQEAFIKLWTNAHSFDARQAKFSTWFYRIVVNKCLDEKRKKRPSALPENYDEVDTSERVDSMLEKQGRNKLLNTALENLPERQRIAVTLSYMDQLSNMEAAEIMDLNIKAYESLLVRARAALRKLLAQEKAQLLETLV